MLGKFPTIEQSPKPYQICVTCHFMNMFGHIRMHFERQLSVPVDKQLLEVKFEKTSHHTMYPICESFIM